MNWCLGSSCAAHFVRGVSRLRFDRCTLTARGGLRHHSPVRKGIKAPSRLRERGLRHHTPVGERMRGGLTHGNLRGELTSGKKRQARTGEPLGKTSEGGRLEQGNLTSGKKRQARTGEPLGKREAGSNKGTSPRGKREAGSNKGTSPHGRAYVRGELTLTGERMSGGSSPSRGASGGGRLTGLTAKDQSE